MACYYNPGTGKNLNIREMPLPKFAKDWLMYLQVELNLAPRTIFNYSVSVQSFLRWVKAVMMNIPADKFAEIDASDVSLDSIAAFRRNDIYEYLTFCANTLDNAAVSRAAKLAAIRSLYSYLKEKVPDSGVWENPAMDIQSPKLEKPLPKYLTVQEVQSLLATVDGECASRDYCILLWLVTCGMRLSELAGINLDDVREDKLRIYGKGRKERVVFLNSYCREALDNYLTTRTAYKGSKEAAALFISPRTGNRLSGRRIEQIVEKYLAKAGLQGRGFSPHKLRHTSGTLMYQSGSAGVLEIKEILGHESVSTTQIYCHTSGNMVESALTAMGDLISNDKEV